MVDIKDGTESRQLAKLETKPKKVGDRIEFTYTRMDGDSPKPGMKASMFVNGLEESLSAKLKTLNVGDEVVVVKVKKGQFWNMSKLEEATTFVAKAPYTPRQYNGNNNTTKAPFDTVGVKVGAARNQAIAFLAATKGAKFTLDDVDIVALEIVTRQQVQEDAVRAGTANTVPNNASNPTTKTKEPEIEDVDDFNWEDSE